jgi:hypothetical protein
MGSKAKDMAGQRFGMLIALRRDGTSPNGCAKWGCRCDCGKIIHVDSTRLRKGRARHCGCQYAPQPTPPITWLGETRTISEWAAITQIPAKLIRSRLVAGWPVDAIFTEVEKPQLCWGCAKSCGGCSWSKRFEPVPGWTAVPTLLCGRIPSYRITECPEFVSDGTEYDE